MNLRKKQRLDYRSIHEGESSIPSVGKSSVGNSEKWSTSKLWPLAVVEERITATGQHEVKVHYAGFGNSYDEWRPLEEVVDIPSDCKTSDAVSLLKHDLLVKVKESLNLSRIHDPEITLHIPIQLDTYATLLTILKAVFDKQRHGRSIYRTTTQDFGRFLGPDWWFKIGNELGDHAYVLEESLQLWLFERRPITDFVKVDGGLIKRQTHRGYTLVVRFVKAVGNGQELDKF